MTTRLPSEKAAGHTKSLYRKGEKDQSPMDEPTVGELRAMDSDEWPAWFNSDDWPRDPSVCRPSDHLQNRVREYGRALDYEMVADAIRDGRLMPARNRCACYAIERAGLSHFVVVSTEESTDGYRVVTAWAWVDDHAEALNEGWSPRLLDKVKRVNGQDRNDGRDEGEQAYMNYINEAD